MACARTLHLVTRARIEDVCVLALGEERGWEGWRGWESAWKRRRERVRGIEESVGERVGGGGRA